MKRPVAKPIAKPTGKSMGQSRGQPMGQSGPPYAPQPGRAPRAFDPEHLHAIEAAPDPFAVEIPEAALAPEPVSKPATGVLGRIFVVSAGILVSLALGLAAEALIRDLFARYEWLGWFGVGVVGLFTFALVLLALREILALARLKSLDDLRRRAAAALLSDRGTDGRAVIAEVQSVYHTRPDLARPRRMLDEASRDLFDGADMVRLAERSLMGPLDARARALTASSARRVALVTAISPRALVDIVFVAYESFRLARAIADLYGARPGFVGSVRLARSVLSHLAITGGVALGDSVIQQLVGHGLAARLSARLGEGLVNGLMTVRVGIAAMRVTRPLPFEALRSPTVSDFLADLGKAAGGLPPDGDGMSGRQA